MRATSVIVATVLVLTGCIDQDPYPLPPPPPGNSAFHAIALGEPVTEAVVFIEARRGQRVEIISAEPVGLFEGASVELYASPLVSDADGGAVVGDERVELPGMVIGDVVDASAEQPENQLAIVAEVTASEPGRYVLSAIHLTYRINGAPQRDGEGIDVVVTVCADDPAPAVCSDDPDG